MVEIISYNTTRIFSLEDAQKLLPLVYRLTEESSKETKYLMSCINALADKKSYRAQEIQKQIDAIIDRWQNKLERLGVRPKGLWLADFDNGEGYFCWKFPEVEILFKHGYHDGFTGRIAIGPEKIQAADQPIYN